MSESLQQFQGGITDLAVPAAQIRKQVNLIQKVMKEMMQDGEHYGKIPGCGDKLALLKPGAEKIMMTFRLSNDTDVEVIDLQSGHREYRVKCTLFAPNGQKLGTGVGSCSTMESKYRYRIGEGELTDIEVPKSYWDKRDGKIIKQFANDAGIEGDKFGKKKNDAGKWVITTHGEKVEHDNPADYYNCVSPETLLLTHDLQWVPAGEIETGDVLIGVEEDLTDQYARHLAIGEAKVHGRKIDDLYEIAFEDGRSVQCNGEHKWLVKKVGLKGTEWTAAEDIYREMEERKGRPRNRSVMSLCVPWMEDQSKEAGYIAGLLDADGSLGTTQLGVLFAQQDNIVLALMRQSLTARGYSFGIDTVKTPAEIENCTSKKQVYQARVRGGITEQMRLLGSIRPPRLLERWLNLHDLSKRRLEGKGSGSGRPIRIISINPIGKGEIVMLGTSCHTYIAAGFACHNTCLKMAKKRALVDATLTSTATSDLFTQDIDDDPDLYKKTGSKQQTPKPTPKPSQTKQAPQTQQQNGGSDKAVKVQIENIKQLQLHPSLQDDFVQYVTDRLNVGLTKKEALALINEIEAKIDQDTPEALK